MGRIRGMFFLQSGRATIAAVLPANDPHSAYPEALGRPTHAFQPKTTSKLIVSNDNSPLGSSFRPAYPVAGMKPIDGGKTILAAAAL